MLIEITHEDEICFLHLSGHFRSGEDPDYVRDKADQINRHNCTRMLADLRELQSIGSMGIGFIVGVYISVSKRPGGRFVLVGANKRIREVLDLTRLSTVLPLATDPLSGLAVLRGEGPAARSVGKG